MIPYDHEKWHRGLLRYCKLCAALGLDDASDDVYSNICDEFDFSSRTADSFYSYLGEVGFEWMDSDSILTLYRVMQVRRDG